jgi:hypothetical protein
MTVRRTYSPQRTFDDDYEGLISLLSEKNFTCSHVDINQCKQDVLDQRQGRATHDALEAKYREVHARFSVEQRERHGRYVRILDAARGVFRDDKAMLAALEKFGRRVRRRKASDEKTPTDTEA